MNMAFKTRTIHGTFLVLNFEFLLVLNHDDVTWDYQKREDMGKKRIILKHIILKK
jgi:hypothetical protein